MPRGKSRSAKERAALLAAYKKATNKVEFLREQGISSATIWRYRNAGGKVTKKAKKKSA